MTRRAPPSESPQTESAKNAEKDMRMMYKRHRKELQEMSDKFKEGEYEDRYLKVHPNPSPDPTHPQ